MPGWVDLKVSVLQNGIEELRMLNPIFQSGPVEPKHASYLTFQGISVDDNDKQFYLDAHISYRQACMNAINYLTRFGYTPEQAYVILGTAPIEGRISGIVDVPNACCTLGLPTDIFDFDVRPTAPVHKISRGTLPSSPPLV